MVTCRKVVLLLLFFLNAFKKRGCSQFEKSMSMSTLASSTKLWSLLLLLVPDDQLSQRVRMKHLCMSPQVRGAGVDYSTLQASVTALDFTDNIIFWVFWAIGKHFPNERKLLHPRHDMKWGGVRWNDELDQVSGDRWGCSKIGSIVNCYYRSIINCYYSNNNFRNFWS